MSVKCVKIEPNNEIDKLLYKYYTCQIRKGWIEVGEEKICMQELYSTIADEIENFEVKNTDIYVTSHPKTGTTWMQELVWMVVNNLDIEGGKKHIYERFPFLEFQSIIDYRDENFAVDLANAPDYMKNSLAMTRDYPTAPRMIKTHMPFSLLPKQIRDKTRKPKIIHVMRNPKDTCVSYYYHCRLFEGYSGNLEDFSKLFLAGRLPWGPFWTNILGYWKNQEDYNILIIRFEDMKKDLASVIRKVADFLGYNLTDQRVADLKEHLSFNNMKNNPSVNLQDHASVTKKFINVEGQFMRSGTVGNYKELLSAEMIKKLDEQTKEKSQGTGLAFEI